MSARKHAKEETKYANKENWEEYGIAPGRECNSDGSRGTVDQLYRLREVR